VNSTCVFKRWGDSRHYCFCLFTILNDNLSIAFFLQDFILEHYSEDSDLYEDEIADLMDLRQVCFCVQ